MENGGQGLAQRRKESVRRREYAVCRADSVQRRSGAAAQRCKDIPRTFARLPEPLPDCQNLCPSFAPLRLCARQTGTARLPEPLPELCAFAVLREIARLPGPLMLKNLLSISRKEVCHAGTNVVVHGGDRAG
jgi:hypothetical protein